MRHFEREDMLGVVRGARGISVAPLREYLVVVRHVPVDKAAIGGGVDAGLLAKFARRGLGEGLTGLLAPGDRLPMGGKIGALEKQDAQVRRVDQDQSRNRCLVGQSFVS
jgi:hypothetical protein